MSDLAIRVENLGKMYRIGGKQEPYKTLRESVADTLTTPIRKAVGLLRGQATAAAGLYETIWALRDVSFEVKHGEVLGIIGHNGAGKSTLLKVLSRITEPTEGYVELYGRLGSLLEVGTGFHNELTGRENIYLNAAILGMKQVEIDRKFDEIVAFAEVEKFIDTPVKHYSSGMHLRLAFAVAAHLEPDILVVDEVLAVGDAAFQDKCINKMREVGEHGQTVVFVSHNMGAITSLCSRAAVLDRGKLVCEGNPQEMVSWYLRESYKKVKLDFSKRTDRRGNGPLRITRIELQDRAGRSSDRIKSGDELHVVFYYTVEKGLNTGQAIIKFTVTNEQGYELFTCSSGYHRQTMSTFSGSGQLGCVIPKLPLIEGKYYIHYSCVTKLFERMDALDYAVELRVHRGDFFGTGSAYKEGLIYVDHHWPTCWNREVEAARAWI